MMWTLAQSQILDTLCEPNQSYTLLFCLLQLTTVLSFPAHPSEGSSYRDSLHFPKGYTSSAVSLQDEKHCNGLQWLDGSGFHFDWLDVSVVVGVVSEVLAVSY